MGQRKSSSDGRVNANRSLLLIVFLGGILLLAFVLRDGGPPTDEDTGRKLSLHMPKVTKAEISPEELRDTIETLVRTHRWFNSLPFARIEYRVIVTKSDAQYERDIAEMKASFPDEYADEATDPTLSRVWKIDQSITFNESRLTCTSRSEALGLHKQTWDGQLLTGYRDYGTTQDSNYYLKSDVEAMQKLEWFPHVGPLAIWFFGPHYDNRLDWQRNPPTLAGATRFAERDCVVLRDQRHHWIVGREDRKLYGRYSQNDWEQFDEHREVADGVFWPMASIRKRYGREGLEWTDRATVTSLEIGDKPDDSVFRMEMEPGVKVCDLRYEYPVVFTSDPSRTEEELAEIYAKAREQHDPYASDVRRSRELISKDAPELGRGTWLNSEPLLMSELRGKRSVLLGFGYTACAPCGNMLAMFSKLQKTSTDQLILVFAATDSISAVEKKLSLYGLECPTFIPSDESGFGEVFERYRVTGYPTIVTIDTNGAITSHQIGTLIDPD